MKIYKAPYGQEILTIRNYLAEFGYYIDDSRDINELWEEFSNEVFCAGWMSVSKNLVKEFITYINDNYEADFIYLEG